MRTLKSAKNIIFALLSNIINIVLGVVVQSIFLKTLGEEYLGLSTLLTSILSMLSIAELGISSAIIYNLYKPIAEENKEKVKSLMKFYKLCYTVIIIVMIIIGAIISIFLKQIVGETNNIQNLYLLYFLAFLDVIFSYLTAYKRSLIYANQKEYIINIIHISYLIIMNIAQIILLYIIHSYLVFLVVKLVSRILENIAISLITNKMYPYIKEKNIQKIDSETKEGIIKNVKALFFHKIAGFIVNGTDTILISMFFNGLTTVAYYSNYNLVLSAATTVLNQFLSSVTASIGDLLTENNKKNNYSVYKRLNFFNFVVFLIGSTGILCLIEPFITIFFGKQYILESFILISLIIKFFIQGMRRTLMAFKEAAGIFYVDRFMPILESIVNIVASIILLKIFGLAGVFLGTALSSIMLLLYSYPKYVYTKLFDQKLKQYYIEFFRYMLIATIILVCAGGLNQMIIIENIILKSIVSLFIAISIPTIIICILFRNKEEYLYYIEMIKCVINKCKGGNNGRG